jgi:23S rRNA (uracil1939-C5)-methyltransferase
VIVDPPRAGLDEKVIEILGQMRSKKILYISCNPKTMSRDLPLLEQKGYRLKRLKGVDQFAQTTHLEMVGLLEIE